MPYPKIAPIIRLHQNSKRDFRTGCLVWQKSGNSRYGKLEFEGKTYSVHKMAYLLFIGEIPKGLVVRHLCHNKKCIEPNHLALGTVQDNSDDDKAIGNTAQGEKHPNAKLTNEQVAEIKRLLREGVSTKELSIRYGVSRACVYDIKTRRWRHIA
jgi:hypothetical protein